MGTNCLNPTQGIETTYNSTLEVGSVTVTGAVAGQPYILSAKYDIKSLVGSPNGPAVNCVFHFITKTVVGATTTTVTTQTDLVAEQGCTVTYRLGDPMDENGISLKAYPNPFSEKTTVEFMAEESASDVSIELFNAIGGKVADLYQGALEAGEKKTAIINGSDLAEGVYLCRYTANGSTRTIRVVLMK